MLRGNTVSATNHNQAVGPRQLIARNVVLFENKTACGFDPSVARQHGLTISSIGLGETKILNPCREFLHPDRFLRGQQFVRSTLARLGNTKTHERVP
jgi:hypothetical protein